MLNLKDKEILSLKHLGTFAVFKGFKKSYKLTLYSEGYKKFIQKQTDVTFNPEKNLSLRQLFGLNLINYCHMHTLQGSFDAALERNKPDILEKQNLLFKSIDLQINNEDFKHGFSIVNIPFWSTESKNHYVIHRIVSSNYKAELLNNYLKLKREKDWLNLFHEKFYENATNPIALISPNREIKYFNRAFEAAFQKKGLALNSIDEIIPTKEDLLLFSKSINEIQNKKNVIIKLKLITGHVFELKIIPFLNSKRVNLIAIFFQENAYLSELEKKTTERGLTFDTSVILHQILQRKNTPKKIIQEGMKLINAIAEGDILQSYFYDETENQYNLVYEDCENDYALKPIDINHPFNKLIEKIVGENDIKFPKVIHAETNKSIKIRLDMKGAGLETLIAIPLIKNEKLISVSFFGFVQKPQVINLDKLNQITVLLGILHFPIFNELKTLLQINNA